MSQRPSGRSAQGNPTRPLGVLVLVPCGKREIWDRYPERGPVTIEAYTGTPFRLNRQYAERFGDAWVILSAKYGFITPDFMIPEPYEVSFKHRAISPIAVEAGHGPKTNLSGSNPGAAGEANCSSR